MGSRHRMRRVSASSGEILIHRISCYYFIRGVLTPLPKTVTMEVDKKKTFVSRGGKIKLAILIESAYANIRAFNAASEREN